MRLTMQFKKYRWPVTPSEITVSYDRNLQEKVLPLKGSLLQDMGRKKRIVTGKGCFFGVSLDAIYDEEGTPIEAAPHATMRVLLKTETPIGPGALLRKVRKEQAE